MPLNFDVPRVMYFPEFPNSTKYEVSLVSTEEKLSRKGQRRITMDRSNMLRDRVLEGG
jgi:hypothetical protein